VLREQRGSGFLLIIARIVASVHFAASSSL
jgi:hypothetical protein